MSNPTCCVDGCEDPVKVKKMCYRHYRRMYKNGTTDTLRRPAEHGTAGMYKGHNRCRCDACTVAVREANYAWRLRARKRPVDQIPHGLSGYNNYGCRCDVCKEAQRDRRHDAADGYAANPIEQFLAARDRYILDHPDFDPDQHILTTRRTGDTGLTYEITGHDEKDPDVEAMLDRCCCHPDKPRGHR